VHFLDQRTQFLFHQPNAQYQLYTNIKGTHQPHAQYQLYINIKGISPKCLIQVYQLQGENASFKNKCQ
jgi:hypothetical protein